MILIDIFYFSENLLHTKINQMCIQTIVIYMQLDNFSCGYTNMLNIKLK